MSDRCLANALMHGGYTIYTLRFRYDVLVEALLHCGVGLAGRRSTMTAAMKKHPVVCMLNSHKPAASPFSLTTSSKSTLPQQQKHLQVPLPTILLAYLLPSHLATEANCIQAAQASSSKRVRTPRAYILEMPTHVRSDGLGDQIPKQQ